MADFDKGTLTGLSLSSEGRLTLAPAVKEIFDAIGRPSCGPWRAIPRATCTRRRRIGRDQGQTVRSGSEGQREDAGGAGRHRHSGHRHRRHGPRLRGDVAGRKGLSRGAAGKSEVFYDPKAKYIWAMAFDKSGNLYVATGDQGEIHQSDAGRRGIGVLQTEETHARSLAVDASGNLIVGTDPSGLILRVDTGRRRDLSCTRRPSARLLRWPWPPTGPMYAAGVGNKQATRPERRRPRLRLRRSSRRRLPRLRRLRAVRPRFLPLQATAPAVAGGSEIYRIQSDGYARKVWSDSQDLVYALAFDARGRADRGHGQSRLLVPHRLRPFVHAAAQPRLHAGDRTVLRLRMERCTRLRATSGSCSRWGRARKLREPMRATCWMPTRSTYWGRITRLDPGRATRRGLRDAQRQSGPPAAELESLGEAERRTNRVAGRRASWNIGRRLPAPLKSAEVERRVPDEERRAGDPGSGNHAGELQVPGALRHCDFFRARDLVAASAGAAVFVFAGRLALPIPGILPRSPGPRD